jgi:hypothetical protein
MASNPVLSSASLESGAFPVVMAPGAFSPWIVAVGQDADARTETAMLYLEDETGRRSNALPLGNFVFSDALSFAELAFSAGTPYEVEVDPTNPLRFRVKNTNAPA